MLNKVFQKPIHLLSNPLRKPKMQHSQARGFFKLTKLSNITKIITNSLPEILILFALAAAIFRSVYFINIGFDPHHDYYALAPGLFASEGLMPHKDFYTHYGAIDAAIKAFLLNNFGKSLVTLRTSLLLLNFLGLLGISYCCKLNRNNRICLLLLILVWATFDPASAGAQATSKGHFTGWSSDIAVFLICLLFIMLFWHYQSYFAYFNKILRYNFGSENKITALNDLYHIRKNTHLDAKNNKDIFVNFFLIYFFGIASGFLVGCIFFTKFTIGLSILVGLILSQSSIIALTSRSLSDITQSRYRSLISFLVSLKSGLNSKNALLVCFPVLFGVLLSVLLQVNLIGGLSTLPTYFSDTFVSQFRTFQSGSSFGLHRPLFLLFTDYTVFAGLITLLLYTNLTFNIKFALFITILISAFTGEKFQILSFIQGNLETANYTKAIGYVIACIVVVGCLKRFFNIKFMREYTISDFCYVCTALPIGLFSLTQFYPITDPFHVWWSVGTALPAAAFLISETIECNRKIYWNKWILMIISLSLSFTLISSFVVVKSLNIIPYELIVNNSSSNQLLRDIRSADAKTAQVIRQMQILTLNNPKSIVLESGYGNFLEFMGSPESRRAYSKCKIQPILTIRRQEYSDKIACLQNLKDNGWDIFITNFGGYPSGNPRRIDSKLIASYAVLEYDGEPGIVKETNNIFRRETQGNLVYWSVKGTSNNRDSLAIERH